jgi:hypothetical protein
MNDLNSSTGLSKPVRLGWIISSGFTLLIAYEDFLKCIMLHTLHNRKIYLDALSSISFIKV